MTLPRTKAPLLLLLIIGLLFLAVFMREQPSSSHALKETTQSKPAKTDSPFRGELTIYNRNKAYPGYTLYSVIGKAKVFLLSMEGKVVHHWDVDAQRARLLPNGHLLVVHGSKWGTRVPPWKTLKYTVREYSWEGEVVWEYHSPYRIHHDIQLLHNGNVLFPVRRNLAPQYHQLITNPKRIRFENVRTDSILEVTRDGNTAWEWKAEDVLDLNSCGSAGCDNENAADWTHINTVSPLPNNHWYQKGDTRFRPGNILTVLRNWWELKIIDKQSKQITWSYHGDYRGGLSGGHDAYMIERGLPGAGNILVLDNGRYTHKGESIILEIEPPTKKIVWKYENGKDFFTNSAGSAQRLPNGNTLISNDLSGRVFEVTPEKEIVWEYNGNYRTARSKRYSIDYVKNLD